MYQSLRAFSSNPLLVGGILTSAVAIANRKQRSNKSYMMSSDSPESNATSRKNLSDLKICAGSASQKLGTEIASVLGTKLAALEVKRFSDGEIFCTYNESVRGLNLFIVQSCAAPVNDNIMELLLLITAARRAGAHKVTAVIPYFGYKYHRRGSPISTKHQSRFLWSAAGDFAKLLQTAGVDMILSVDLQRPGQGHEACFFDSSIPVETINSTRVMADYFKKNIQFDRPVVVVAANAACMKKAISFRKELQAILPPSPESTEHAVFIHSLDLSSESEFLGDVEGSDAIIVDDIVDTAGSLSALCHKLKKKGARKVYLCASHGLFTKESMGLIDLSLVEKVIVTDTIPLQEGHSKKIIQIPMARLIAHVIDTEYFRAKGTSEYEETYEMD